MTTPGTQAGSARHQIVRAGEADIDVLAQVIADAFFSLAVCRWLIPDGPARRAAFPGYSGLYVEHAIADGLVETTPGRDAAALWIPGDGPGAPPDELRRAAGRHHRPAPRQFPGLRSGTGPSPPGRAPSITTWRSWRSGRTGRARAPAPRCCTPTTPSSKTRAYRPTWKPRTNAPAASTSPTATPTGAARSNSPTGCGCTRCGASRTPAPDNGRSPGGSACQPRSRPAAPAGPRGRQVYPGSRAARSARHPASREGEAPRHLPPPPAGRAGWPPGPLPAGGERAAARENPGPAPLPPPQPAQSRRSTSCDDPDERRPGTRHPGQRAVPHRLGEPALRRRLPQRR